MLRKSTNSAKRPSASPSSRQAQSTGKVIRPSFELPDGPYEPEYNINQANKFIYGEPGIGKTSFCSKFPDAVFFMTEPGGKFLRIARIPKEGVISTWEEFTLAIDNLLKSDRFQTVVIDTADNAYLMCTDYIVKKYNAPSVNEGILGYGKGVDFVDAEFKKQILRIVGSGRSIVFTSHGKLQEYAYSTGQTYNKLQGTIKDRGRRFINGFVDITGYYGYAKGGEQRYLQIQGSEDVDAKQRIEGRFITTTGEPIYSIDMGGSSDEAYANFLAAFNNKQVDIGMIKRKAELSEQKAAFKGKGR